MKRRELKKALHNLKRRKFSKAVDILEAVPEYYTDSFEYFLILGIAYLYIGDIGRAYKYFRDARQLNFTNSYLLLGLAVIFLRRGQVDKAISYYLEVRENDPSNKVAIKALEFIKENGDKRTVYKWVDSGKIMEFYPPLGVNPNKVCAIVFPIVACLLGAALVFYYKPYEKFIERNKRAGEVDLRAVELSVEERRENSGDVNESYDKLMQYIKEGQDNHALHMVNTLLLNEGLSANMQDRVIEKKKYLNTPSLESLLDNDGKDNISYSEVATDLLAYKDCYVYWEGKITNYKDKTPGASFDLIIGSSDLSTMIGVVHIEFNKKVLIDKDKRAKIFGKITIEKNKLVLAGEAINQGLN